MLNKHQEKLLAKWGNEPYKPIPEEDLFFKKTYRLPSALTHEIAKCSSGSWLPNMDNADVKAYFEWNLEGPLCRKIQNREYVGMTGTYFNEKVDGTEKQSTNDTFDPTGGIVGDMPAANNVAKGSVHSAGGMKKVIKAAIKEETTRAKAKNDKLAGKAILDSIPKEFKGSWPEQYDNFLEEAFDNAGGFMDKAKMTIRLISIGINLTMLHKVRIKELSPFSEYKNAKLHFTGFIKTKPSTEEVIRFAKTIMPQFPNPHQTIVYLIALKSELKLDWEGAEI